MKIDTATAARLCQHGEALARETLNAMETSMDYLVRGGSGRGTYWTLRSDLQRRLHGDVRADHHSRTDWEAAKVRVLSVLRQRWERGEDGLTNAQVRAMTRFDRRQVNRLIHELEAEGLARLQGHGRGARYVAVGSSE